MKCVLRLDIRKNQERKNGFPVTVFVSHKGKRSKIVLGLYYKKNDWDFEQEEPKNDKRKILFVRKKKLQLDELVFESLTNPNITIDFVKNTLLSNSNETVNYRGFYEFAALLISEMLELKDEKGFEKRGNVRVYENAINQLKLCRSKLTFNEVDYNLWFGFKRWQLSKGNKKSTINAYLRTYRAIYNEAVRRGVVKDTEPFKDVMKTVYVKKNRTKKKHVSKAVIKLLENLKDLPVAQQRAVDLWLLQFYFGGQDLKDIYYLENSQIANGRVFFVRGKLDDNGYQFDVKIVEKAQRILDKYRVKGRFAFDWRKTPDGYNTFRRRLQYNLVKVQENYNKRVDEDAQKIEVLPLGGNLGIKVARHSFGTIGSRLLVEPDVLRAIMGHERDDVDTIYKDVYPEALRDEWHEKIIDTK